jgi:hypothetical protein
MRREVRPAARRRIRAVAFKGCAYAAPPSWLRFAPCYGRIVEADAVGAAQPPVRRRKPKRATPAEVTVSVVLAAVRSLGLASAAEIAEAITRASGGRSVVSGRAIRHFADRASVPWVGPADDRRYFMPIDVRAHPLLVDLLRRLAPANGTWHTALVPERIREALPPEVAVDAVLADVNAVLVDIAVDEQARDFVDAATSAPVAEGSGRLVLLLVRDGVRALLTVGTTVSNSP